MTIENFIVKPSNNGEGIVLYCETCGVGLTLMRKYRGESVAVSVKTLLVAIDKHECEFAPRTLMEIFAEEDDASLL